MLDRTARSNQDRVVGVVTSVFGADSAERTPTTDEDLREFGMTSLNMVNLMLAIEAEFDITIPKRELHPDNFRTLTRIEDLVARLTNP